MYVDFDKLQLSYIINGKDYGVAFKITKGKYKVAINMYQEGDIISLV